MGCKIVSPMDIIVNADDLGMTREINGAIFELMQQGAVTSASFIANAPYVEEACKQVTRYPLCSFGVHLNVTEFRPLSSPDKLESLLDEQGAFVKERIRRVRINSTLAGGIFQEFCDQIDKLSSLGITVSHIDSHNGVHVLPKMFPILKKVQRRFGIQRIRLTRNIFGRDEKVSRALRLKKALYNFMLRHYVPTKTTQGFCGFKLFYECAIAQGMKHRTMEVMVHPANPYYDGDEVELLRGPWREHLGFPVRLVSFHDLV